MATGGSAKEKPTARLQLTTSHSIRESNAGAVRTFKAPGLEIGAAKSGKPALHLNGQSKAETEQKLGLNDGENGPVEIFLIVGLAVVGIYAICCLTLLDTD